MRRLGERGDTLVEVVMALGILSLVLVSSYALATGTFRLGRGAGERTQAVNYLQQQAEALRTYRDQAGWSTFRTAIQGYGGQDAGGTFCMQQVANGSTKLWKPTGDTGGACVIDGKVIMAITSKSIDSDIASAPDGLSQQYQFDVRATWDTARGTDNASIRLTLADQGITP